MNFNDYFSPISQEITDLQYNLDTQGRYFEIELHTASKPIENIQNFDIALIGIPEDRNTPNKGSNLAPDAIREKLYQLYKPSEILKIIDLGNVKLGKTVNDTYFAVKEILGDLIDKNVLPIILGGGLDLAYANFLAYQELKKSINIVSVDSRFNLANSDYHFDANSVLQQILLYRKRNLFNFSTVGYQTYYVAPAEVNKMKKMFFDTFRLGEVKDDIRETEPIIRDADMMMFNISAIKQSDAPANYNPSPNGFTGEEACQIARYAGMSDKVSSFGIYEVNPKFDQNYQTSHLAAQVIWYFIEGFYLRKKDYPFGKLTDYKKFIVNLNTEEHELIFYKSIRTERWWLEIPYTIRNEDKKLVIACSHEDYQKACRQEIPDRWWKWYQKIR